MRVLVVSEGKHERSGALENILNRLGGNEIDFDADRVSSNKIHAFHGQGPGYFKRAISWILHAQKNGYDALILLVDEDGQKDRVKQIRDAQDNMTLSRLSRALGVAIRTFDAWMLADEKALTDVLGYQVNAQPNPETIKNPKMLCKELLERTRESLSQRDMYARLTEGIDLDLLEKRCPAGFGPFASRVRAALAMPPTGGGAGFRG